MTQLVEQTNTPKNAIDAVDKLYKYSEILAGSTIIPSHYRGKTSDVFVAVQTAYRMNLDPMMVMQGTYIFQGRLGMYTSFAISLANSSGILQGGIHYKLEGSDEDLKVTAFSTIKANGQEISYTIGMKEAKAEGWTKNTKYSSLPELMLRYRAATLLIRTHIPEVLNGMHTVEELRDVAASKEVRTMKEVSKEAEEVNVLDQYVDEEDLSLSEELEGLIAEYNIPDEITAKWCKKGAVETVSELTKEEKTACINHILKNNQNNSDVVNVNN